MQDEKKVEQPQDEEAPPSQALVASPTEQPFEDGGGKADPLLTELEKTAKTFAEREAAFQLASGHRQALMIRKAAQAMSALSWGKDINPVARAAVARYCFEVGCDPLRHVNVLAGNVYFNAAFYQELVAANPDFLLDEVDLIHDDDRADEAERKRRAGLRVTFGVPEKAPGAAVVTLRYRDRGPFIGVNWAGVREPKMVNGRLKGGDPVGKDNPTQTAITRAYRKAAIKAEPTWFRKHPRIKPVETITVESRAE